MPAIRQGHNDNDEKSNVKGWCIVFFDLSDERKERIKFVAQATSVTGCVVAEEICPKTNRPHLQAWFSFNRNYSFRGLKRLFNDETIHIENARSTKKADQLVYCCKDPVGFYLEKGMNIKQGQR